MTNAIPNDLMSKTMSRTFANMTPDIGADMDCGRLKLESLGVTLGIGLWNLGLKKETRLPLLEGGVSFLPREVTSDAWTRTNRVRLDALVEANLDRHRNDVRRQ